MQRNSYGHWFMAAAVCAALCTGVGCNKLRARDKLNKGVEAYKAAQFDTAVEDFKTSSELDPNLTDAKLFLARAYSDQYIDNAPSPENLRNGNEAIRVYKEVLVKDPNNLKAIDGVGSMLFRMSATPYDEKKMEEARSYFQKHIELQPADPDPYYSIGSIDWTISYKANMTMREDYNKGAKKPLKDASVPLPPDLAAKFTQQESTTVDAGISALKKAIQLKPDYDDAMAFLNLLYRQKADTETSVDARNADLKMADDLVDKVRAIKQKRAQNPQPSS